MLAFNFATAQRIVFGSGKLAELGKITAQYGKRILCISGGQSLEKSGRLTDIEKLLIENGLLWERIKITCEPTVETVDKAVQQALDFKADAVLAIGGGSVLDAGKAVAALLANGGRTIDYLEGVGRGGHLTSPSLPCIAVPTTSGTGAEATKNSVISNAGHTFKKSLRSDWMLPSVALVDPELTKGCPPAIAAACGMDAITQLIEAFTSNRANPMIDALAGLGLAMASKLPKRFCPSCDEATYEALALASLLGGIALANAGLGAVHGLASPLGALFPIPHGVVCAMLLPPVIAVNARKAAAAGNALLLEKYAAVAIQLLSAPRSEGIPEIPFVGIHMTHANEKDPSLNVALTLSSYLKSLVKHLGIPGLASYNVKPADFQRIIAGARGNSMRTNPVKLDDNDLLEILMEAR